MNTERRTDPFRVNVGPRLGAKLTRAVALAAGAALLVSGLIFDVVVYVSLRAAMVDDLTVQAHIVAENSSAAILFGDSGAAALTLAGFQASADIRYAELRNEAGQRVASYAAPGTTLVDIDIDFARTPLPAAGHLFADDGLYLSQPVREGTRAVGSLRIVAKLDSLYRRVGTFALTTLAASLLAFGVAFVLVVKIRDELNATEQRLDYLAFYDPVTGLPNRHAANDQIARLIATVGKSSDGFALLLLDLDDFKVVNDTLGHGVGDDLLRALATRLTQFMRPTDIAFRFGGDEFVILAPRVSDPEHEMLLGQAAMLALESPLKVGAHELQVRGSVGVAQFPRDANNAAGLIRAADTAMYEAKRLGKNTYALYDAALDRGTARRMRLESDLRTAVLRDELRLVYQPIVDLGTGRMRGVEALVRWVHPEFGVVSPVEFIPLAEYNGLIVDVGQWVLLTACKQMKRWSDDGYSGLFVAVNVSARQIRRGVKAQIDSVLAQTGLNPASLEIEITEHSMVEDIESNVAQLQALREIGIQVAVDDFGTGLSSLAYLKRLPIGKLKIDRAFVKDLPGSSDDAAIASAIVSMAHSLGLTVVAEGVETEAQRDFLAGLGCDCAQGYLYSRPVPPEALAEMLAEQLASTDRPAAAPVVNA